MVSFSLEQISIVYYILGSIGLLLSISYRIKLYEYFKRISKWLSNKIKQLMVFLRELPRLWRISDENSRNYESMIDFKIDHSIFIDSISSYDFIKAGDNISSPRLNFKYLITNYSIFDFEIQKIDMQIRYNNDDLGSPVTTEGFVLPHQKIISGEAKLEQLHPNFISKLKIEIIGKEKLFFDIRNVNIFLTGDKEFHKPCGNFMLEIPIKRVNVS